MKRVLSVAILLAGCSPHEQPSYAYSRCNSVDVERQYECIIGAANESLSVRENACDLEPGMIAKGACLTRVRKDHAREIERINLEYHQ